jgi:hypothetical protein
MTRRTLRAARKHLAGRSILSWPALVAVVLASAGFAGSASAATAHGGTAAGRVSAASAAAQANPVQSLPAFPYPLMATYNGTGSVDVASSYHAAPPPVPFDAHIDWLGTFSPANHHR